MWYRPFLFVAYMLTLPVLSGTKTGENETMAVCPLCFAPSLPNDVQDMVRWGQASDGLAWMWFGQPLGWLLLREGQSVAPEVALLLNPPRIRANSCLPGDVSVSGCCSKRH